MLTTGQRIKKLRKKKTLTQAQLAELLGVHVSTVCYWETDRNILRGDTIAALASALDVSVVELLSGKGEDNGEKSNPCK